MKKCCGVKSFVLALILAPATLLAQPFTFSEQGPGPIANGQAEGITTAGVPNPVAGAVNAFAFQPGSSEIMYAATVNGGIWKTTNATSASPTWTPLTDRAFPSSLSINSIAISPVDNNTIYAGTGSTSSDGFDGNPGFGVAKSTDGGATWTLLGGATFAGMRLADIIPTSLGSPSGSVVMTANFYEGGGVYRSTDGGSSFTRISGAAGSGLPSAGVSSLVADPGNANRFYAAVPHISSATAHGIYKSTDGGQTWALVAPLPGTADNNSFRTLLAVHNSANGNVVWAMVIDSTTGSASGIFSSNNQGGAWVSLGVPSPILFPGGQGTLHGAISADPSNPNLVYVAGDRQDSPFPNANGCNNFSGNVYLGNSSTLSFTNLVCNGANGTSPHADSRWMAFDSNGNLLNADDGGLFRLSTPTSSTRAWSYVGGVSGSTMRPTEFDSISYDPLNNVFFGGAQDVGSSYQLAPGSFLWNTLEQGDGGYTDIDADQTAHPNTSLRYFCYIFMSGCYRASFSNTNAPLSFTALGLNAISGPCAGMMLTTNCDKQLQFFNPYVLDRVTKTRMLIGSGDIYESMDRGDSLTDLVTFAQTGAAISSLSYGSDSNADAFYVAAGGNLWHRVTLGGSITSIPSPSGAAIRAVVMDPHVYQTVYIVDNNSHVWMSTNEGAAWTDITSNLSSLSTDIRTIEVYSPDAGVRNTRLIVGGAGGGYILRRPGAAGFLWTPLGSNLPHGLVLTVKYDYTKNVLGVGYLGRGAWSVTNPFGAATASGTPLPPSTAPPPASPLPVVPPVVPPIAGPPQQ